MKKLKFLSGMLTAVCIAAVVNFTAYANETINMTLTYDGQSYQYSADAITLKVDGQKVENLVMPPVNLDGSTYVPVRAAFEAAGAVVDWDGENSEATITYNRNSVVLKINNIIANVNGVPVYMDMPPKIINDATMVPIRFTAEALGFTVGWDGDTKSVLIYSPEEDEPDYPVIDDEEEPEPSYDSSSNSDANVSNEGSGGAVAKDELARDVSAQTIAEMSYGETSITDISASQGGSPVYTISASSEISKVNTFLLEDNRLVIDIYNAQTATEQSEYNISSSEVSKIWIAQNQMEPEKITRVVLQLTGAVDYTISISNDRKNIYVGFEKNEVNDISFSTDGVKDYLRITGTVQPSVDLYTLTNPDRIVVDIPYTQINDFLNQSVAGRFVTQIETQQISDNMARVTMTINDVVKYNVSGEGSTAVITVTEPPYRNIRHDDASNTITLGKGGSGLNAASITHTDNYTYGQYILTLPGDYSSVFGYGEFEVNGDYISSIVIDSTSGNTTFTINENQILVFNVEEDANNIYIRVLSPKSVYSKVVIIDPGHGGSDPGTSGNNLIEKELTLDISKRVMELLEQNYASTGIKGYATRLDDRAVGLYDRAPIANAAGDLFVSVHINSASPNTTANGTETYYYPHANDSTIGITTKQTAEIFHKHLMANLGLNDRKVKENSYVVIKNTIMPSVLCELAFVSNADDAAKLADPEFRQKAAQAIYDGILETFSVYTPQR